MAASLDTLPGPPSHLLDLVRFRTHPLEYLDHLVAEHGDFCRFTLPTGPRVLVNRPDLLEEVLVTRAASFHKGRVLKNAREIVGEGLLSSEGDLHLRQRRMMSPLFTRKRVEGYAAVMGERAAAHAEGWVAGEPMDLHAEVTRLTLDIVGRTLFATDLDGESRQLAEAVTEVFSAFALMATPLWPLLDRLPLPQVRRYHRSRDVLNRIVNGMIAARRADPDAYGDDLLSLLVRASDPEDPGARMSDEQVRAEAMTLVLAGHETTANALAWTLWLLATHPEDLRRVQQEADALPADRPADAADLADLAATRRAVTEALRLYPPLWAMARQAEEDTEVGGVGLPRGSVVLVSPWLMHRRADFYPDPLAFRPDRWLPEAPRLPRHAFTPFGAGLRMCLGESFAWTEATVVLAEIARRWDFEVRPSPPVEPQAQATLRMKHGLPVVPRRRAGAPADGPKPGPVETRP